MSVKGGLAAHLKADPAVAAIVGDRVEIFPMSQGVDLPFVVYRRRRTEHVRHLGGLSGLRRVEFEVSALATDSAVVDSLAEAIRVSLDGFRGVWAGTRVTAVYVDELSDIFAPDIEGGEDVVLQVDLEVVIWHREAVPA
jgi:hypothetical protein